MSSRPIILVIGARGFLGRRILSYLSPRFDFVFGTNRERKTLETEPSILFSDYSPLFFEHLSQKFARKITVINCAGSLFDLKNMSVANTEFPQMIMERGGKYFEKFIQISSAGVYGPQWSGIVDEVVLRNHITNTRKQNCWEKSDYRQPQRLLTYRYQSSGRQP